MLLRRMRVNETRDCVLCHGTRLGAGSAIVFDLYQGLKAVMRKQASKFEPAIVSDL